MLDELDAVTRSAQQAGKCRLAMDQRFIAKVRAVKLEQIEAEQSHLAIALLRNRSGAFVRPDSGSLRRTAAEMLANTSADSLHGLVGARDPQAYPVVAITRLVVDKALGDARRGAHFLAFARWALRDGAHAARALGYAPLPPQELRRQNARLDGLTAGVCPSPRAG